MDLNFRRLTRTERMVTPKVGGKPFRVVDIERELRWSLMSDGKMTLTVARWSQSNYAYIDTNLEPIRGSGDLFTHAVPLGFARIMDIGVFVTKGEGERAMADENMSGDDLADRIRADVKALQSRYEELSNEGYIALEDARDGLQKLLGDG